MFELGERKSEAFAQKLAEAVQAHNLLFEKYNELKSYADLKENENTHLIKKVKEAEATLSAWEAELKKVNPRLNIMRISSQALSCSPLSRFVRRCLRNIPRA